MTDHAYRLMHEQDLDAVLEATRRLLTSVGKLDDAALPEPSLLPGWTRGHVLAHIARNADALVNVLTSARTGSAVPMYADERQRDAEIERDAVRPLAAQVEDLTASAERFNDAAAALNPEAWTRPVALRGGVTDVASRVPFRRLTEVELHHIDLRLGAGPEDLPASYTDRALEYVTGERFAGRSDTPALLITTDDGRSRRTGRSGVEPVRVSGSAAALLGWLTGRTNGAGLVSSAPGAALPPLPPLG